MFAWFLSAVMDLLIQQIHWKLSNKHPVSQGVTNCTGTIALWDILSVYTIEVDLHSQAELTVENIMQMNCVLE